MNIKALKPLRKICHELGFNRSFDYEQYFDSQVVFLPYNQGSLFFVKSSCWLLYSSLLVVTAALSCRQSEFQCSNGRCLSLNKVCNLVDDCGDKSDEQQQCSPCNKTYYGDVGKTYDLELHRPKEDKVPYICRLTFNAPGGDLGDIVQVTPTPSSIFV
ncbi:hypothetical protein QAD02_019140 [Eretmocerus hayati]|uniref:Uncharacterized protein n=1 Tax=Eretmocerus hayati TaxID=131215 RepID=A0ACC2PIR7_9HYME|nr:hypothetical protein QAD02_019140 [Eretmocerus hayati]